MQTLRKLSIRARLIMSSVLVAFLMTLLAAASWFGFRSVAHRYSYVVDHEGVHAMNSTLLDGDVAKMRQYEKDMIINGADKGRVASYFAEWEGVYKNALEIIDREDKLADDDEDYANVKEAKEHVAKYYAAVLDLRNLLDDKDASAEKTNARFAVHKDNIRSFAKKMSEMSVRYREKAAEEQKRAVDAVNNTLITISGIVVLALFLAILSSMLINQSIMRPLKDITERVQDVARGNGDLTKRVQAEGTDELALLGTALNQFMQVIHEIIKDVIGTLKSTVSVAENLAEASQSLSTGTEEMSQQTQSIATASQQLHQNLEVVSSSIEEMSISVSEIARRSVEAATVAGEANTRTATTNDIVTKLGQNAREIGKVIESIVDIADQTNLLALNAAIEAADAGDAGKRFAVVASEVKELARQTSESSEEVKTRIETIQKSSEDTIKAIESITNVIQKVNEVNSAIASFVEEQSITAREISTNATQAASVSTDVARNVGGVSEVVKSGAQEATRISGLATQLNQMAQHLTAAVGRFKV